MIRAHSFNTQKPILSTASMVFLWTCKSDQGTPLLKTLYLLWSPFMTFWALYYLALTALWPCFLLHFPSTLAAPATLTSLLLLNHSRHSSILGSLWLFLSLPGNVFSQILAWLTPFSPSYFDSSVDFSIRPSLAPYFKVCVYRHGNIS